MTRESFGIGLSRLAALVLAVAAALAIALAIAPGTALAAEAIPPAYVSPDGAGTVDSAYDNGDYVYEANPAEGYKFVSWTIDQGHGTTMTSDRNPLSLVASADLDSVTAVFEQTPTPPTAVVEPAEAGTVTSAVLAEGGFSYTATANDGWEFSQWNVVHGEGGAAEQTDNPLYVDDNVQAVTAYFKKQDTPTTYKISATSASSEGGTVTVDGDKKEAAPGDTVKLIATPTDRSWEFTGWTVEEPKDLTIADDGSFTMPSASVVVQGNFKKKDTPAATYKITVTAEPAEGGAGSADKQEAAEGDTVTLAAVALDGYEFVEWKTATSGVTITNNTFTMPASDVAVTAVFKKKTTPTPTPVTTYAIAYDANGGTGTMDKQSAEAGATITLTANAFKRDGYTFAGWNTAKDGSGTAYSDKASVKVEGDLTLYAQWKAASSSSNKAPKTGDTALPLTVAVVVAAIAAGALLAARRKMN